MKRRLSVLLAVPLLLILAACAPAKHVSLPAHPHTSASRTSSSSPTYSPPTPSATPATTKPIVPPTINPATYLIDGTPNVPDANGEWYGQWAFFTDASKTVWCQFIIFSGDNPGASCSIVPADHALATYPLPPGRTADCSSDFDGYTLATGGSADDLESTADAGWDQCIGLDPDIAAEIAKSLVLPDGATLAVAPFSCTVHAGVATCAQTDLGSPSATITLGLHTASFHSTV